MASTYAATAEKAVTYASARDGNQLHILPSRQLHVLLAVRYPTTPRHRNEAALAAVAGICDTETNKKEYFT